MKTALACPAMSVPSSLQTGFWSLHSQTQRLDSFRLERGTLPAPWLLPLPAFPVWRYCQGLRARRGAFVPWCITTEGKGGVHCFSGKEERKASTNELSWGGGASLPREAHRTGLPKPAASYQLTAVSRKLAQNPSSPSVGSPLHCSLSQKGQDTLGRGGGERPSTNPLLEITIQQRSWNLGCESLQAP